MPLTNVLRGITRSTLRIRPFLLLRSPNANVSSSSQKKKTAFGQFYKRSEQRTKDTPRRMLLRKIGTAYEVYPFFFLAGAWVIGVLVIAWWSLGKTEVWIDRSKKLGPTDWERQRDQYFKLPTVLFDKEGITRRRLHIMEKLQDEMIEAAKKRGTR